MTFLKILFENSDNKTILKNLKQELMSVIKLNFNYASYIFKLCKDDGRRDGETDMEH